MADQRRYGAHPGFRGYAASTFKRLPRARKLEVMESWFRGHYEDPANRVSYNGREGGYLWVPGLGPNDADNEIQEHFSDVADFGLMMEAVEAVQADGVLDWASSDYFREIDEEALRERDEESRQEGLPQAFPIAFGSQPSAGTAPMFSDAVGGSPIASGPNPPRGIVDPDIVEPGIVEDDGPPRDEAAVRRRMLEDLEALEREIAPLLANAGMMGHNGPPGPIEDPALPEHEPNLAEPPLTAREIYVIKAAIEGLREQAQTQTPDVVVVGKGHGVLSRAARQIGRWLMMAADEAVKAAGKAAGVTLVASAVMSWQHVGPALETAASSVSTWIQTIEVPW